MRYPAIIAAVALALLAVGLVMRGDDLPYSTDSREAYELYERGLDELNAFRFHEATEALEASVAADSSFAMAQAALAAAVSSMGDRKRAERIASVADSLADRLQDPDERLLVKLQLSQRGLAHRAQRDSLLQEAIKRMPEQPLVLDFRAQNSMMRGDIAKAAEYWNELLRIDPNYARAYNWLGYLAAAEGDYEQALSMLRKYAYLSPNLANPHDSLGEILTQMGDYDEAERELRRALELQPDFFYSLAHLADVYIATGRLDKGIDLLQRVREQFAGTAYEQAIDAQIINAYRYHRMWTKMAQAVRDFVRRHPDSSGNAYFRAVELAFGGHPAKGKAVMDSLMGARLKDSDEWPKDDPRLREIVRTGYVYDAITAEVQHDYEASAAYWRKALEASSYNSPYERLELRIELARALAAQGLWSEVLEQTRAVAAINPNMIPALSLQVLAQSALGQTEEARRSLARLQGLLAGADRGLPAQTVADSMATVLAADGA